MVKKKANITDATRTVRFKKEELEEIEAFLAQNPFFDFSTLVRVSLKNFMSNPKMEFIPLNQCQKHPVPKSEANCNVQEI